MGVKTNRQVASRFGAYRILGSLLGTGYGK